jgi:hypothetical protein
MIHFAARNWDGITEQEVRGREEERRGSSYSSAVGWRFVHTFLVLRVSMGLQDDLQQRVTHGKV